MGAGIAIALVEAGINVQMLDLNDEALSRGMAHCEKTWNRSVEKGRITPEKRDDYLAKLRTVTEYSDIADCDLVIEAVVEQMKVKKSVFETLDGIMKPGALLATNTSTLNVDEIAAVTNRPGDVIGLHFFSPANIMKLLEIVRGAKTSDDVLATATGSCKAFAQSAGGRRGVRRVHRKSHDR